MELLARSHHLSHVWTSCFRFRNLPTLTHLAMYFRRNNRDGDECVLIRQRDVRGVVERTTVKSSLVCPAGSTLKSGTSFCMECPTGYEYRYVVRDHKVIGCRCVVSLGRIHRIVVLLLTNALLSFVSCICRRNKNDCYRAAVVLGPACDESEYYVGVSGGEDRCLQICEAVGAVNVGTYAFVLSCVLVVPLRRSDLSFCWFTVGDVLLLFTHSSVSFLFVLLFLFVV